MEEAVLSWTGILVNAKQVLSLRWEDRFFCCPVCGAQAEYRDREGTPYFAHEDYINPFCPERAAQGRRSSGQTSKERIAHSIKSQAFWMLRSEIQDQDLTWLARHRTIVDGAIGKLLSGKADAFNSLDKDPLKPLEKNALSIFHHPYFAVLPRWISGLLLSAQGPMNYADLSRISTSDMWGEFLRSTMLNNRRNHLSGLELRHAGLRPAKVDHELFLTYVESENRPRFLHEDIKVDYAELELPARLTIQSRLQRKEFRISTYTASAGAELFHLQDGELELYFEEPFGLIVTASDEENLDEIEYASTPALLYVYGPAC